MNDAEGSTTRRMSANERRVLILDVAATMIAESGFQAISLNAIAKAAGITNAGLLHHFGSKDGLLIALLQERDRQDELAISQHLGQRLADDLTADEVLDSLRAIVERNVGRVEFVRLYAMLRAEALDGQHPAHDFFVYRERAAAELVRIMLHDLVEDPVSTTRQVLAVMQGLELQWLREGLNFDLLAEWDKSAPKLLNWKFKKVKKGKMQCAEPKS